MKIFITILCLCFSSLVLAQANYHAQGRRVYHPITVSVTNAKTEKPLAEATVRIELDKRLLLSAGRELNEPDKTIDNNFYKIQKTNDFGLASLFYISKSSEYSSGVIFEYRTGTIAIELEGYKTKKINLANTKTSSPFSHSGVSHLEVKLETN